MVEKLFEPEPRIANLIQSEEKHMESDRSRGGRRKKARTNYTNRKPDTTTNRKLLIIDAQ